MELAIAVLYYVSFILKVSINFLPVHHTHEDVDQFFSRIAAQLRKTGAESVPGKLVYNNYYAHLEMCVHSTVAIQTCMCGGQ